MYKYMYFSVVKMKKLCILFAVILLVDGVSAGYDQMLVSVNVGDSLTLHTGYIRKQEDKMTWYFNNTRIAQINGNVIKICTDVQCDETFRDRLQLNTQTGDLTITNITTEHTGMYHLQMINSDISLKIFNLSVEVGVPWADRMKKVNEGESVSLDSGVTKKQNDSITWYFNGIRIAQINGNTSEACTDVQCDIENERLRDRLKLNDRTGSLTITNARITDTGEYQLEISSSSRFSSSSRRRSISFSSRKTYSVTVIESQNTNTSTNRLIDHSQHSLDVFNAFQPYNCITAPDIYRSRSVFRCNSRYNCWCSAARGCSDCWCFLSLQTSRTTGSKAAA
ncbi:uncharacterized protein LOC127439232 isoform X3 [Myxocyprinus asiaticus]|uniref:uncharacterized protein LOC127439232 isoform X3 n=1 Tax=Myxocyprinus asiaticus TaxID=70543 RepID=UPI0022229AA4|nr:uncharacterized protein LOC127439232 isoform X3 [Myxocyprinus asiaticus]XP_051551363.1 uncharacterized protein LOC127439232 isoform X3 [Myxocyprinus asiaticus]